MNGITLPNGRCFVPTMDTKYTVLETIVVNQRLSIRANAVLIQNAGTVNILLDGGFTLVPGQSFWYGNYREVNTIKVDTQVIFDLASGGGGRGLVQRLEVMVVLSNFAGSGFYIDQPAANEEK